MMKSPDGQFKYIGHFFDHHTKYNVLFPLKSIEAKYAAQKLCRHVFGYFGLPKIMYSNYGRSYLNELIRWTLHLWSSDAQIISGDPQNKKMQPYLNQRQRTVMILIETIRTKQSNTNSWASWLPGIQCKFPYFLYWLLYRYQVNWFGCEHINSVNSSPNRSLAAYSLNAW